MKQKIIDIIGHGMEPERAECKADEITDHVFEFIDWIKENCEVSFEFINGSMVDTWSFNDVQYNSNEIYQKWTQLINK